MVTQSVITEPISNPQRKKRKRKRGRVCKMQGCGGEVKQFKRKNCATHITRRFRCMQCGLRWTSVERDLPNSIVVEGPHGTRMAAKRLAELAAKQEQSSPVYLTQRLLFN